MHDMLKMKGELIKTGVTEVDIVGTQWADEMVRLGHMTTLSVVNAYILKGRGLIRT